MATVKPGLQACGMSPACVAPPRLIVGPMRSAMHAVTKMRLGLAKNSPGCAVLCCAVLFPGYQSRRCSAPLHGCGAYELSQGSEAKRVRFEGLAE